MTVSLPRPLLDALVEDRVVPLIGAGFSRNGDIAAGRTMPTWDELGELLEAEVSYLPPRADPIEVISAYVAEHGRQALVARLRRALNDGFVSPGLSHRAFAELPFDVVVTTNFDPLLEDAYRELRRPMRVLVREDQLASLVPRSAVSVVKAHGDYDNEPVLIATERDYDEFLLRRPLLATYLANLLITRVVLLIGYSLTDSNWRQLLAAIRTRLGDSRQTVYAIEIDADPAIVERFRRRGVRVINISSDGRSYAEVLSEAFQVMRNHIARHTLDNSIIRDERALEELRGVSPEDRRLCLFLIPERLLAYYRQQVFPLFRDAGVQPVTAYDVDTPSATLYAQVIALLDQARAVVVDLSTDESGPWFELALARTARHADGNRIAIVVEASTHGAQLHTDLGWGRLFVRRPGLDAGFEELEFPDELREWAREIFGSELRRSGVSGAAVSFEAEEPEWQIVSAFRDLELALTGRLGSNVPFSEALRTASRDGLLPPQVVSQLRNAYRVRNEVLHRGRVPTRQEALSIVDQVRGALRQLDE
jgi:SIR2-like domain